MAYRRIQSASGTETIFESWVIVILPKEAFTINSSSMWNQVFKNISLFQTSLNSEGVTTDEGSKALTKLDSKIYMSFVRVWELRWKQNLRLFQWEGSQSYGTSQLQRKDFSLKKNPTQIFLPIGITWSRHYFFFCCFMRYWKGLMNLLLCFQKPFQTTEPGIAWCSYPGHPRAKVTAQWYELDFSLLCFTRGVWSQWY